MEAQIVRRLRAAGVVPVVVIANAADAVDTARALLSGGIDVMEITFRTPAAAEAIRLVHEAVPEMLVGAGTVLNVEQCQQAVSQGAEFIVSPGFDEMIAAWCIAHKVTVVPGCVTPGEIMAALRLGICMVKFFPANIYGGLPALQALSAPFRDVSFLPTGGIHAENLAQYLAAPFVCAAGGSWLCRANDIASHDWAHITALCREAKDIAERVARERGRVCEC